MRVIVDVLARRASSWRCFDNGIGDVVTGARRRWAHVTDKVLASSHQEKRLRVDLKTHG